MPQLCRYPGVCVGTGQVSSCRSILEFVEHELCIGLYSVDPGGVKEGVKIVVHALDVGLIDDEHFVGPFGDDVGTFEDLTSGVVFGETSIWADAAPVTQQRVPDSDVLYRRILLPYATNGCIKTFWEACGIC